MKKRIIIIIAVCLLSAGIFFLFQIGKGEDASKFSEEAGDTEGSDQQTSESIDKDMETDIDRIDYAKIYSTHTPDEVIGRAGGHEITWSEYFRFFYDYATQIEEYMSNMTVYYGETPSWTDIYDESTGITFAGMPSENAERDIKQYAAINGYATEKACALSEASKAQVAAAIESAKISECGAGATDEEFREKLGKSYMTPELYEYLISSGTLYKQMFADLYGTDGSRISEDKVTAYLEDYGYVSANHILFITKNRDTGETADEDTARIKRAQAASVSSELQAIENLNERKAKFLEYKTELDEDSGKTAYPEGYTYTAGTMVTVFENAVTSLGEYEVSDPVESVYGYHVIMRMPLSADAVLEYAEDGTAVTARAKYAEADYAEKLQAYMESMTFSYVSGFKAPDITDYIISK